MKINKKVIAVIFVTCVISGVLFVLTQKNSVDVAQQKVKQMGEDETRKTSKKLLTEEVKIKPSDFTEEQRKVVSELEENGWEVNVYRQIDGKYRMQLLGKTEDKYKKGTDERIFSEVGWDNLSEDFIHDLNKELGNESVIELSSEEKEFVENWKNSKRQ